MKTCALALLLVAAMAATAAAAEWFVAPDGTSQGTGTQQAPWDLQTALLHPEAVQPGDTIWLHGGTYSQDGNFRVHLQGTEAAPIVVRNYQRERVTLRASLDIAFTEPVPTRHCWLWGLEVQTAGGPNRGSPANIGNSQHEAGYNPGIKLINCIFHDCNGNGLGCWASAEEEVYGCLVYYNGGDGDLNDPHARGHGHGFYIQSKTHKAFRDNIVFRQFNHGFQIYGTDRAQFKNVTMEGNAFFNNGEISIIQQRRGSLPQIYVHGGDTVVNPKLVDNCVYAPTWPAKSTINVGDTVGAVIRGNYFVSPGRDKRVALDLEALGPNPGLTMRDNTFIGLIVGFDPKAYGDDNVHRPERPTSGKRIFVRPNKYEEGRANIIVFNWDKSETVQADLSAVGLASGAAYEIRDAQDWYGEPVVTGVYDGAPVTIPMTGLSVAEPIGRSDMYKAPPHTGPEFGAFVVVPVTGE